MSNISIRRASRRTQEIIKRPETIDWDAVRAILQDTADLLDIEQATQAAWEATLERRAEQVAPVPAEQATAGLPVITFRLGQEAYAVPVEAVRAVDDVRHLTPVPCVPSYYRGVTNVGGKIMSVLDLIRMFGISQRETEGQMLIVVAGADLEIGLLVDAVEAVMTIAHDRLHTTQALGHEWLDAISAVTADGLILLDVEQLFRDPRIRIYEEAR